MDEFSAITGVDADTAAMYMEMSGYDLDTAIQLFVSMSGKRAVVAVVVVPVGHMIG